MPGKIKHRGLWVGVILAILIIAGAGALNLIPLRKLGINIGPACEGPLITRSPVDMGKVSSILYPGQVRGGDYKAHGGFRINGTSNSVDVVAPHDMQLVAASRYLEMDEVQILLLFEDPCGIEYRFDHLREPLPAALQKAIDKFPAPKEMDSRTRQIVPNISVKTGDVIATAVGFTKGVGNQVNIPNVSFDFGLYDRRSKNQKALSDTNWAANHPDYAHYGLCWLEHLPSADAAVARALPGGDSTSGKTSDYCN